jgi:hypothetical protein
MSDDNDILENFYHFTDTLIEKEVYPFQHEIEPGDRVYITLSDGAIYIIYRTLDSQLYILVKEIKSSEYNDGCIRITYTYRMKSNNINDLFKVDDSLPR